MHDIRVDCRVARPVVIKLGRNPTDDQVRSKYLVRMVQCSLLPQQNEVETGGNCIRG